MIELDLQLHKAIEAARESTDETQSDILKRMLGLSPGTVVGHRAWSGKGITLPHGTKLRMTRNDVTVEGEIADGAWLVNGKSFGNPSTAAREVSRLVDGEVTALSGWIHWFAKRPCDPNYEQLIELRG